MANRVEEIATKHVQDKTDELAAKNDELRALTKKSRELRARGIALRAAEDEAGSTAPTDSQ